MSTRTTQNLALVLFSSAAAALTLGSAHASAQESTSASSGSDWSGYYLGLKGGYTWSESTNIKTSANNVQLCGSNCSGQEWSAAASAQSASGNTSVSPAGAIGGGLVGYNWQANQLVYGVEADIQLASNKDNGSSSSLVPVAGNPGYSNASTTAVSQELTFLSTFRGRLGYLLAPELLMYGTGGLAVGGAKSKTNISQSMLGSYGGVATTFSSETNTSETLYGWTLGAGIDWKFMQDYSVKAEYLYYDLGDMDSSHSNLASAITAAGYSENYFTNSVKSKSSYAGSVASLGISYHFK
jgi:outer membrane immunogenic protein